MGPALEGTASVGSLAAPDSVQNLTARARAKVVFSGALDAREEWKMTVVATL